MNWKHVHLIFLREINDQLRDRRTLFTITILPILLYPLLGMLMMQIAQFNREHTVCVRVIGAEHWPTDQPLLDEHHELAIETGVTRMSKLIEFQLEAWPAVGPAGSTVGDVAAELERLQAVARLAVKQDLVDAVLIVEPGFESMLQQRLIADRTVAAEFSTAAGGQSTQSGTSSVDEISAGAIALADADSEQGLHLIANLARDHSQIARSRLEIVLNAWKEKWVALQLASVGMNPRLVDPIPVSETDTALSSVKRAMLWSKVLPFVMLVWALTGAFYPAIDLCAGEKERGTLETLLSSPARRREIVWGKLLTVSVFSIGSALLNLMSMHLTAGIIVKQLAAQGGGHLAEALGPMPFHAFGWLVLLLLPMAAFFSALALAVAALARSTKEGQYYLMPLLLVTLPLVALPMLPNLELSLGTSLVPVSGAVFLVRSLIEGRYTEALVHLPVVMLVTVCCCSLSLRWAIRQFESESVMFSESERWNMRLWLHQLWRDRGDTASPTEAILCGVVILVGMFFAQFVAGSSIASWADVVKTTTIVQIGLILAPCLLMATFLTRSIRRALRVHRTQPTHLAAAVLLGISMHPSYTVLGQGISSIYELGEETRSVLEMFQQMVVAQPLWAILLVMAVLPAICEELAFRGFIFGGLLRQSGALRAIVVSALFFGFTHTVLQQSIAACMMGLVLGLIAWRTGGVICTMIVHLINNTLSLSMVWCAANAVELPSTLSWAVSSSDGQWSYQSEWITMSVMLTLALLIVLFRRSHDTQKVVQAEMV